MECLNNFIFNLFPLPFGGSLKPKISTQRSREAEENKRKLKSLRLCFSALKKKNYVLRHTLKGRRVMRI
jgi:hypothetical protein